MTTNTMSSGSTKGSKKLPVLNKIKIVAFYRTPKNINTVVMQVPSENNKEESETYKLNLQNRDDCRYLQSQKNGLFLVSKIQLHAGIAYIPRDGEVILLEAVNENRVKGLSEFIAIAHREHQKTQRWEIANNNKASALWRKKPKW